TPHYMLLPTLLVQSRLPRRSSTCDTVVLFHPDRNAGPYRDYSTCTLGSEAAADTNSAASNSFGGITRTRPVSVARATNVTGFRSHGGQPRNVGCGGAAGSIGMPKLVRC